MPDAKTAKLVGQQPLSDKELDQLGAFLAGCGAGRAMNVAELDRFFCALVMGPELIMPNEYLPIVLGGGDYASREAGTEDSEAVHGEPLCFGLTIAALRLWV